MPVNFVKFQRGSQNAYDALKLAGRLEPDALYFIYNGANVDTGGKLYLGERLISGSSSTGAVTVLGDLTDVNLAGISSATEPDGMILQYNAQSNEWQAVSIKTAVENSGANIGTSGEANPSIMSGSVPEGQTITEFLNTVDPVATRLEGDIVFADGVPYIWDGSNWQLLVGQDLEDRVSDLEDRMDLAEAGLQAVDGKITSAISLAMSQSNHLKYTIPQDGQLPAVSEADANTVYLISNGESSGDDRYDEYMLIGGSFERIGNWAADLSDYVTTTTFNTSVGSLDSRLSNLEAVVDNIDLTSYLTINQYTSEVGRISDLRTTTGDQSSTVIGELLNVRNCLAWNEIDNQ